MALRITDYTESLEAAVGEFNNRLEEGGVSFRFPGSHVPSWLPRIDDRRMYQEYYLAVEDDATVRGGYILKHQDFLVGGEPRSIGNYQLPLSEGVIDRAYNLLGLRLVTDALSRQPLLYSLGMGGFDRPLPQLLEATGWKLVEIPFFFKAVHPFRFLRNITALRTSRLRKLALDFLAISGIGSVSYTHLTLPTN